MAIQISNSTVESSTDLGINVPTVDCVFGIFTTLVPLGGNGTAVAETNRP